MKFYLRGLAFGAILIALGLFVRALIAPFVSADILKVGPTIIYISSFILFGYFHRRDYGPFWPLPNSQARNQAIYFLLGCGTAVSIGTVVSAAGEYRAFNGSFSGIIIVSILSLVFIPLFSFYVGASMLFGSFFHGLRKKHEPEIRFVIVAEGQSALELEIIQARLRAEGIPAFILNGDIRRTIPVGDARLEVPENHADKASRIIAAINAGSFELTDGEIK